ncbi:hypothetical protein G3M48_007361 [Beauveria asiatica]|uniref:Uncharacterized protein n=1 Tax=Beauveria asiatica TaxID=1069075 RepID=A0AAW0RND7_9HYPO
MAPLIAQTIGLGTCSEHLQLMAMWNNLAILCLALANQSPDPAGSSLWNGPSSVLAWCARVEVPNAEAHLSVWLAESQQICAQHERRFRHTRSSKQLNSDVVSAKSCGTTGPILGRDRVQENRSLPDDSRYSSVRTHLPQNDERFNSASFDRASRTRGITAAAKIRHKPPLSRLLIPRYEKSLVVFCMDRASSYCREDHRNQGGEICLVTLPHPWGIPSQINQERIGQFLETFSGEASAVNYACTPYGNQKHVSATMSQLLLSTSGWFAALWQITMQGVASLPVTCSSTTARA